MSLTPSTPTHRIPGRRPTTALDPRPGSSSPARALGSSATSSISRSPSRSILAILLATAILAAIFAPLGILGALAFVIVPLAYFPYFWAKTGQTPGMKLMGIKVVRDKDGGPVTTGQAILRLIGYWVSGLVFYLGYIWIFVDKRKRGWMDLIAGTIVISAPNDLSS